MLLNGCSSTNMKDFENKTPKLNLFEFFKGETVAYGIFEDRFGKLRRQFRVKIKGSVEENTLTLDEKFIYDDGEKATRIWKIKKLNEKLDILKKTIEENNSLYESMLDKTTQSLEKIISNTESLSKIQ